MALETPPCVVIAGAGDVGGRLAALRVRRGDEVIALRRREVACTAGIRSLRADLATGAGLERLPRQAQAIVFCAAPDERSEPAYRALYLDGLRRLLDACDAPRLLFVSSTAVYGEDAGEWVDEATPARPPAFNGRVLFEAEHELAPHAGSVVLRLSGLYGPGREAMLRRAQASAAARPRWSNRIHVDDAASALAHLLDLSGPGRLYLGTDDRPVFEHELVAWLRQRDGLPPPSIVAEAESGRRISNGHLRVSGWAPHYPDFTAGYGPSAVGAGV